MEWSGHFLAIVIGVSLGLIGSGGSILTVPILVYVLHIPPEIATAESLFVVGIAALVGSVQNALKSNVDFKTALLFGAPSLLSVYLTRKWLVPLIPDVLHLGNLTLEKGKFLMLLFAFIMFIAAINMILNKRYAENENRPINYPMLFLDGIFVGFLTGLVGVGGGFLILPALVLLAKLPMKKAVGTSLVIIAANAVIGFASAFHREFAIDWAQLLVFTGFSALGILIGNVLSTRIEGQRLKSAFGWFVLIMAVYIVYRELH